MDLLSFLRLQYEYDIWANREALASLEKSADLPERIVHLMTHILAAEELWLQRLQEASTAGLHPFPSWTLETCHIKFEEMNRRWKKYLDGLDPSALEKVIAYRTTEGTAHSNRACDILFQILNHSTHHRGQIALLLRKEGHVPAVTDYIVYMREERRK